VLSKCLNPACSAQFRYLHEGKIFKIATASPFPEPPDSASHKVEYFWLCGHCAQTLKVVLDHGVVTIRPLPLELSKTTPEEDEEDERHLA